ncbi:MAG: hypothetical protein UW30_C0018G0001 [Candidatus Giovannonibacteria bacterium GW2011_GWA2_44_13b]|uniref:Glycosyltransferase subfamily 4-like N-terminal domain-containing protein n=1 Tax=Candidatus Giovannonibacteria bacterium GW2011_GWA2_44_13b TaxID=1618647 RepID=A0A0G1H064_9BACT|nr:MAG: hypothetical protein UW30_C0018G0001 [Candidatus Giovannonibacteria bacterium GW2011_GWA2_44_13b]
MSFKIIEGIRSFFGGDVYVLTGLPGGQKYEKTLLTNSAAILKNFFRIRKIFKECDVIHAMDTYPYGIIAALASLGLGKKIIITAVGSGSIIPLYSKIFFLPSVFSCKRADAIVAISNTSSTPIGIDRFTLMLFPILASTKRLYNTSSSSLTLLLHVYCSINGKDDNSHQSDCCGNQRQPPAAYLIT